MQKTNFSNRTVISRNVINNQINEKLFIKTGCLDTKVINIETPPTRYEEIKR